MTEQDNTPTSRELLDSVDPLTLEVPAILTLDDWTTVLAVMEHHALTASSEEGGVDGWERTRTVTTSADLRVQLFSRLHEMKSALLETGVQHQYQILLDKKP